jgi:hypothetical protein
MWLEILSSGKSVVLVGSNLGKADIPKEPDDIHGTVRPHSYISFGKVTSEYLGTRENMIIRGVLIQSGSLHSRNRSGYASWQRHGASYTWLSLVGYTLDFALWNIDQSSPATYLYPLHLAKLLEVEVAWEWKTL